MPLVSERNTSEGLCVSCHYSYSLSANSIPGDRAPIAGYHPPNTQTRSNNPTATIQSTVGLYDADSTAEEYSRESNNGELPAVDDRIAEVINNSLEEDTRQFDALSVFEQMIAASNSALPSYPHLGETRNNVQISNGLSHRNEPGKHFPFYPLLYSCIAISLCSVSCR